MQTISEQVTSSILCFDFCLGDDDFAPDRLEMHHEFDGTATVGDHSAVVKKQEVTDVFTSYGDVDVNFDYFVSDCSGLDSTLVNAGNVVQINDPALFQKRLMGNPDQKAAQISLVSQNRLYNPTALLAKFIVYGVNLKHPARVEREWNDGHVNMNFPDLPHGAAGPAAVFQMVDYKNISTGKKLFDGRQFTNQELSWLLAICQPRSRTTNFSLDVTMPGIDLEVVVNNAAAFRAALAQQAPTWIQFITLLTKIVNLFKWDRQLEVAADAILSFQYTPIPDKIENIKNILNGNTIKLPQYINTIDGIVSNAHGNTPYYEPMLYGTITTPIGYFQHAARFFLRRAVQDYGVFIQCVYANEYDKDIVRNAHDCPYTSMPEYLACGLLVNPADRVCYNKAEIWLHGTPPYLLVKRPFERNYFDVDVNDNLFIEQCRLDYGHVGHVDGQLDCLDYEIRVPLCKYPKPGIDGLVYAIRSCLPGAKDCFGNDCVMNVKAWGTRGVCVDDTDGIVRFLSMWRFLGYKVNGKFTFDQRLSHKNWAHNASSLCGPGVLNENHVLTALTLLPQGLNVSQRHARPLPLRQGLYKFVLKWKSFQLRTNGGIYFQNVIQCDDRKIAPPTKKQAIGEIVKFGKFEGQEMRWSEYSCDMFSKLYEAKREVERQLQIDNGNGETVAEL